MKKKKTWNILSYYVCMAPVITEVNLIVMFIMLFSSYNGSALFDREAISRLKNLIPQVWKKYNIDLFSTELSKDRTILNRKKPKSGTR